ncbi:MAG: DUF7282 domain-containing protein [Anderseniella sp.]
MSSTTYIALAMAALMAGTAFAGGHAKPLVKGSNQDASGGTVTASEIVAGANGWLVVHRTGASRKPGPVIGHAPVRKGTNKDVAAILTEPVKKGEQLMLMLHGEAGGKKTGIFEYTLGAREDGPVKVDGKLVMSIVQAQ